VSSVSAIDVGEDAHARSRGRTLGRHAHKAGRQTYAALDLGTNNCRLLIARPAAKSFKVVDAFSRIVRLGEGIASEGRISEGAMSRTVDALKVCSGKLRRRGVTAFRAIATEACRRASNGREFLARVEAETGLVLEIISPQEEAALTLSGCAPLLDPDRPHAVAFDIGGGSTEVSHLTLHELPGGARLDLDAFISLPFGVVTLAERYGAAAATAEGYRQISKEVGDALERFKADLGLSQAITAGAVQLLGSSGTVTTLTGIDLGLPRYDRSQVDGAWLDFGAADEIMGNILSMTPDQRAAHPCIGRDRAEFVVAGCAVLDALLKHFPVGRLRVADRGVREGILLSLMRRPGAPEAIRVAPHVWRKL